MSTDFIQATYVTYIVGEKAKQYGKFRSLRVLRVEKGVVTLAARNDMKVDAPCMHSVCKQVFTAFALFSPGLKTNFEN